MAKGKVQKPKTAEKKAKAKKKVAKTVVKSSVLNREPKLGVPQGLEECAVALANSGKIDKAKRTAECIQDEKVKLEILGQIEKIAQA